MTSRAEMTLEAQLDIAGIYYEREFVFAPPRKYRADFIVVPPSSDRDRCRPTPILIEVDGGTWIEGRHNRGSSIAAEYEKGALAAIRGFRVIHATSEQVADGTCLRWIIEATERREAA